MVEPNLLADSISAINSVNFTPKLMSLIGSILSFDNAIILGLRSNKHPIYLYDSISDNRELLFERYLTSSFQDDPFYKLLISNEQQGVFTFKDVVVNNKKYPSDYSKFYLQTGWKDELNIVIEIEPKRWIVIYLGCTTHDNRFSSNDIKAINSYFDVIQSLCQQHWKQTEFLLAEPLFQPQYHTAQKRKLIEDALKSFGKGMLSEREKQIAALIVQGLDTKEISLELHISDGTVKNHRKRIYAKLHVVSLSELFQLFLNHLITQ